MADELDSGQVTIADIETQWQEIRDAITELEKLHKPERVERVYALAKRGADQTTLNLFRAEYNFDAEPPENTEDESAVKDYAELYVKSFMDWWQQEIQKLSDAEKHLLAIVDAYLEVMQAREPETDLAFDVESITDLTAMLQQAVDAVADPQKTTRRKRPAGLAKLQPIEQRLRLSTQNNLTGLMLDVSYCDIKQWIHTPVHDGYALQTKHGMAIIKNASFDGLRGILDRYGAAGLQFMVAALHHVTTIQKAQHGTLPEWRLVTPTRLGISDLLRSMGKNTKGAATGFGRQVQWKARQVLESAGRIEYVDIKPAKAGAKMNYGPMVSILNTEIKAT